jgi:hypothetical protein
MSQPDNLGGKFPGHVYALLNGTREPAEVPEPIAEIREPISEVREPVRRRSGVSIGQLLVLMLISAGSGSAAWEVYGGQLRSKLGVVGHGTPLLSTPYVALPVAPTAHDDALLGVVRDLQQAQKHTADQLEKILESLASQQTVARTTSDALAALTAKIETFQPPAPTSTPTVVASKPTPVVRRRKRSARPKPPVVSEQPVHQAEPAPVLPADPRPPDPPADLRR